MSTTFSLVESRRELSELADAWRVLANRADHAFTMPEWTESFLNAYEDTSPFIATLESSEGGLQALLSLARQGHGARSTLRFAGANLGDAFAPVATSEAAANDLGRMLGAELKHRRDWDALVLENVQVDSPWIAQIASAPFNLIRLPHRDEVLPFADIEGLSWQDFLAARSRNFRSQIGKKARALEHDHAVRYRLVEHEGELERALDDFYRLHDARWDTRGGSKALTERSEAFHRTFSRAALANGWLRLWLLEIDGKPAAAWYGWRIGDRYSYYQAGFDPTWSRQSVGLLMQARTVRAAIEEGAKVYDLLLGGEGYKGRFADAEERVATYVVARRLSRARAIARAEVAARALTDRLSPALRARVKRHLGRLARRTPGDVRR